MIRIRKRFYARSGVMPPRRPSKPVTKDYGAKSVFDRVGRELTPLQASVLAGLPGTVAEVAQAAGVTPTQASGVVRTLSGKGLARRVGDRWEHDGG